MHQHLCAGMLFSVAEVLFLGFCSWWSRWQQVSGEPPVGKGISILELDEGEPSGPWFSQGLRPLALERS